MKMRKLACLMAAVLAMAGIAFAADADEAPHNAKARAARNRGLVARYAKSFATVRYYVKRNDEGREPKFRIPYLCPNCSQTHWRDENVSVEKSIPAEFVGFVLSPTEILMQDVRIESEFIARIEVACAGEVVAAVESAGCPGRKALVLTTEKPLANAVPLAFAGGGEPDDPDYFYIVREKGLLTAAVTKSGIADFRHLVDIGRDVYKGKPNTLVLNGNGEPVTVNFQKDIVLGEEDFQPPSAWPRVAAAERFAARRALERRVRQAVLPAYLQLEAPSNEDGGRFRRRISFSSDGTGNNDVDTVVILIGDTAIVPVCMPPKGTARLVKMEATLPDGTKAPLEFVGSSADYGVFFVRFKDGLPAGLVPFARDGRSAAGHYGEELGVAGYANQGGQLVVRGGEMRVEEFDRTRGNETVIDPENVMGPVLNDESSETRQLGKTMMFFSSEGLVAMMLPGRKGDSPDSDREPVQGTALARLVTDPVCDPENVPRQTSDRQRTPWLGVEVQKAGADIVREKKAASFFRSRYRAENEAALVTSVATNSPAAQLGLQEGDILISARYPDSDSSIEFEVDDGATMLSGVDWNELFDDPQFIEVGNMGMITPWPNAEAGINGLLAAKFSVGSEIVVAWVRDGKRMEGRVTLALAPVHYANAPRSRNKELGMTVCDMTDEVRKYFKFAADAPGVVVAKVKNGGTASVAGIRPLELILEVNGEGVFSARDFAEKTKGKQDLTFTVRRLTATRMVPIRL